MKRKHTWLFVAAGFGLLATLAYLLACGGAQRTDGGRGLLPVGATTPTLSGSDQAGIQRGIADARGGYLLVFFYPKDNTPGCTTEACALRDAWDKLQAAKLTIYGVSSDDQASHADFATEHRLPFPLIADPDHVWSKAFGVPTVLGMAARVSFLIDPEGKVAHVFPNVDPALHLTEVLAALRGARGG
jgi:peroxiredoxin Q/BCP